MPAARPTVAWPESTSVSPCWVTDTAVTRPGATSTAADGGGLANRADSTLRISNVTFWNNRAHALGGGLLHDADQGERLQIAQPPILNHRERPVDFDALARAGAVGFSDDGESTRHSGIMRQALEASRVLGLPVMVHCEDKALAAGASKAAAMQVAQQRTGLAGDRQDDLAKIDDEPK